MSDYANDAYLTSLNASRGDVDRHIQNALGEVSRQSGVNQGQAALIPNATGAVAAGNAAQVTGDNAALGGMLTSHTGGIGSLARPDLQPGQDMTLAALGAQQGAFASTAPLLQSGFQEQADQRTAGVQNIGSEINTDLTMQANQYAASRDAEARNMALQQNLAQISQGHAAQIAAQQIAAQAAEAEAQRQFQGDQNNQDRLFQGFLVNPPTAPLIPWGQTTIPSTNAGRRNF